MDIGYLTSAAIATFDYSIAELYVIFVEGLVWRKGGKFNSKRFQTTI